MVILFIFLMGMDRAFAHNIPRSDCLNNLRIIAGAKDQAALERNLKSGEFIESRVITEFCKSNRLPECPAGGRYVIRALGADPWCTIHGGISEWELNLLIQVYETREKAIRVLVTGIVLGIIGFFTLRFLINTQRKE